MEDMRASAAREREFAKLHGLGNDFVFFNDWDGALDLSAEQVKRLCDRRFGIGADGVILVRPSQREDCVGLMYYINADGTLAQMCGNGVRCFAKYLVDYGIVDASRGSFTVETLAGPRLINFEVDAEGKLVLAQVDMGAPILDAPAVPIDPSHASAVRVVSLDEGRTHSNDEAAPLEASVLTLDYPEGPAFDFVCVSMGNPHAICFIDEWDALPERLFKGEKPSLESFDIDTVGAYFENHPAFPEKTNVEFASMRPDGIAMRVYERGCGETSACGTGACATLVAAALTGRAGRKSDVLLRGGVLHVLWREDDHVIMTGPAQESFTGTVLL